MMGKNISSPAASATGSASSKLAQNRSRSMLEKINAEIPSVTTQGRTRRVRE